MNCFATFLLFLVMKLSTTLSLNLQHNPDYKAALKLSLLFYEAQRYVKQAAELSQLKGLPNFRSGHLPSTNRIKWRGDSALNDTGQNGEDLTGGYYDASDFVKFSFTMTFTTTMLSWGLITYKDGYIAAGQYNEALEAVKWATDYFIKCHISPNEFYGQVGDFNLDHSFWGRPEEMNMTRPAYKIDEEHPGSDLAGEASAALSAASIIFRKVNATYSDILVQHAKELFEFAANFRGLYHEAIPGGKIFYEYESTGYGDELTWAAIWLYKATNDVKYIEHAESFYTKFRIKDRPNEFFFNKKVAGIQLLLAEQTLRSEYLTTIKSFCDYSIDEQDRTPKGLLFIDKFGTLSHAANIAFICLQAASLNISETKYILFAKQQLDYILGSTGRSYIVGFGRYSPTQPHHSASSCPDLPAPCGWKNFVAKTPNPQILYGALVSGPDQKDHYEDIREEFLYNEVTLYYNAGYQGALAGLIYYEPQLLKENRK